MATTLISNVSGIVDYMATVAPSDSADLPDAGRVVGVRAGGAGNLAVRFFDRPDTETVTIVGVLAGETIPARIRRVMNSNTNATDIVALYARS